MEFSLDFMSIVAAVVVLAGVVYMAVKSGTKGKYYYPPSPMTMPIVGHDYILKSLSTQSKFAQWLSKQGPIVRLILNGKNWIGINSLDAANSLLIKNGTNFSSRPFIPFVSDVIFRTCAIALLPYGEKWRKHRRLVNNLINPTMVSEMEFILKEEVDTMIKNIDQALQTTDFIDITPYLYDYAFSVIIRVLFGKLSIIQSGDERPFLVFRKLAHDSFLLVAPPKMNLSRFWPFANRDSKSQVQHSIEMRDKLDQFIETYLSEVRRQINEGQTDNSVAKKYLQYLPNEELNDLCDKEFTSFLTNLLLAATETVGDNLAWTIAAITKHHEHQIIAQEQIDLLDREPTINDMKALYYTQNIIKECLRMYPSNVFNLPRENVEHHNYQGYDIPAGTTIVVNIYAINRDPKKYTKPNQFNPTRYETKTQTSDLDPLTFGMGRRMCPGINLAKAEMFYAVSNLL